MVTPEEDKIFRDLMGKWHTDKKQGTFDEALALKEIKAFIETFVKETSSMACSGRLGEENSHIDITHHNNLFQGAKIARKNLPPGAVWDEW